MREVLLPSLQNQQLKGSVHYLGKLNLHEVRSCVKGADIFLLPSLWENLPYSCLEAMAAGRAIVASAQGGVPELIEHGSNGLLAKSDDPESFIKQIRILLDDPALGSRLGHAARKSVQERFTDDRVARQSVEFYSSVLQRRSEGNGRTE
jgi:glycosyltransferase involved in cell wall biosynthesis